MDPFNPFAGIPGDPMEQVLSLQTYSDVGEVVGPACSITSACRTCTCATNSCDTQGCTFSCPVGPGREEPELDGGW